MIETKTKPANKYILGIDTGYKLTAYTLSRYDDLKILDHKKEDNETFLERLEFCNFETDEEDVRFENIYVSFEMIANSYGHAVGSEIMETVFWIGRFYQVCEFYQKVYKIPRKKIVKHICGTMKGGDTDVRRKLIKKYAKWNFKTGKGTKQKPDFFYGVAKDEWSAFAVACTTKDIMEDNSIYTMEDLE